MSNYAVNNVDLKLLKVFMSVVKNGGFSLAQADLNVSQATISIQIKNLETRLGLTLCHRGRGGFALTEDGQRVYDATFSLFNQLDEFRATILSETKLVGELKIAVIDNMLNHPDFKLSHVIEKFNTLNHDVDINLHVDSPNQLEHMVLNNQVHMAIGYFPRRLSQLEYCQAYMSQMQLYCGNKHPLFAKKKADVRVEDIFKAQHAQRGYVSYEQTDEKFKKFNYTARADSIEGLMHLVLSGDYLAFLPKHSALEWVSKGFMKAVLSDIYSYPSQIEIIRKKSSARTPVELKFFQLIGQEVNS